MSPETSTIFHVSPIRKSLGTNSRKGVATTGSAVPVSNISTRVTTTRQSHQVYDVHLSRIATSSPPRLGAKANDGRHKTFGHSILPNDDDLLYGEQKHHLFEMLDKSQDDQSYLDFIGSLEMANSAELTPSLACCLPSTNRPKSASSSGKLSLPPGLSRAQASPYPIIVPNKRDFVPPPGRTPPSYWAPGGCLVRITPPPRERLLTFAPRPGTLPPNYWSPGRVVYLRASLPSRNEDTGPMHGEMSTTTEDSAMSETNGSSGFIDNDPSLDQDNILDNFNGAISNISHIVASMTLIDLSENISSEAPDLVPQEDEPCYTISFGREPMGNMEDLCSYLQSEILEDVRFPGVSQSIWATCPTPPPSLFPNQSSVLTSSSSLLKYLCLECGFDLESLHTLEARFPVPQPAHEDATEVEHEPDVAPLGLAEGSDEKPQDTDGLVKRPEMQFSIQKTVDTPEEAPEAIQGKHTELAEGRDTPELGIRQTVEDSEDAAQTIDAELVEDHGIPELGTQKMAEDPESSQVADAEPAKELEVEVPGLGIQLTVDSEEASQVIDDDAQPAEEREADVTELVIQMTEVADLEEMSPTDASTELAEDCKPDMNELRIERTVEDLEEIPQADAGLVEGREHEVSEPGIQGMDKGSKDAESTSLEPLSIAYVQLAEIPSFSQYKSLVACGSWKMTYHPSVPLTRRRSLPENWRLSIFVRFDKDSLANKSPAKESPAKAFPAKEPPAPSPLPASPAPSTSFYINHAAQPSVESLATSVQSGHSYLRTVLAPKIKVKTRPDNASTFSLPVAPEKKKLSFFSKFSSNRTKHGGEENADVQEKPEQKKTSEWFKKFSKLPKKTAKSLGALHFHPAFLLILIVAPGHEGAGFHLRAHRRINLQVPPSGPTRSSAYLGHLSLQLTDVLFYVARYLQ
ncbi:hypothetical protein B0H10DRAFT_2186065 [Mycena sp. CBHHK59/15]|nr:hypothetical protein B0H10DRAFT_2186065 [Mycena sp. CBHHK59/15]